MGFDEVIPLEKFAAIADYMGEDGAKPGGGFDTTDMLIKLMKDVKEIKARLNAIAQPSNGGKTVSENSKAIAMLMLVEESIESGKVDVENNCVFPADELLEYVRGLIYKLRHETPALKPSPIEYVSSVEAKP